MENILVVIRDEIRENRKVLEEIRDLLVSLQISKTQAQMVKKDDKSRRLPD